MSDKDKPLRLKPEDLKPCPFCGRKVIEGSYTIESTHEGTWVRDIAIDCACGAQITIVGEPKCDAVCKWNRRK